jgi:4'-phosphopantetheinyl transferase
VAELTGIEVVIAQLDRQPVSQARAALLSDAERARAARFGSALERRRYIAAHATLRELLAERCGQGATLRFSLSRKAGLAAFAFASRRAVGIDIEAVRPVAEADAIAATIFSGRERRAFAAAPDKVLGFLVGWTRTEALGKALGRGLLLPAEALEAAVQERWSVRSFIPFNGFVAALAAAPDPQ